jgi:hypothetical protein
MRCPPHDVAVREESLKGELAELTKPAGDVGGISFGKRVGEGTSMAVDRLAAVSAQEHLLAMLEEARGSTDANGHCRFGHLPAARLRAVCIPAARMEGSR